MNPMGWQPYKRRLSYIQSTGTQFIDTGVTPTKDMVVDIDCDFPSSLSALHVLFGARKVVGSNYNAFIIWHDTAQGQPRFDFGSQFGASSQSTVTFPITNFRKQGTKNYVNGVLVSQNSTVSDLSCDNSCRLFAAGSLGVYYAKIKVSRCRVWQDGTSLTRDFIPVLDKSDVPCMYDMITRTLFYNGGTGTFNYA